MRTSDSKVQDQGVSKVTPLLASSEDPEQDNKGGSKERK
jgi:hypothetical protein